MKTIKFFFASLALISLFSCSKDTADPAEQPVAITMANLAGRYNITSMVKLNSGSLPFKGYCPTKNDVLVVLPTFKVYIEKYYPTCGDWSTFNGANGFTIEANGVISQNVAAFSYFRGKITELTATKFRLVFDEPTYVGDHFTEVGGNGLYTSILYTRIS